jgi:hypothetical protein
VTGRDRYRATVTGRLSADAGGGRCTVIVAVESDHPALVMLSVAGAIRTTAILTRPQAIELAGQLSEAATGRTHQEGTTNR